MSFLTSLACVMVSAANAFLVPDLQIPTFVTAQVCVVSRYEDVLVCVGVCVCVGVVVWVLSIVDFDVFYTFVCNEVCLCILVGMCTYSI